MNAPEPWLYRYEVKGIQAWILASDTLKDLKAGSAIIAGLADEATTLAAKIGGTIELAAAGQGQIAFPDRQALHRFAAQFPLRVEQHAPGVTFTHAWVPASKRDALCAKVGADRQRPRTALPEIGPLVARASRTGNAAVKRDHGALLDAASRRREKAGHDKLTALVLADESAETLDDLHHRAYANGLAVVHADGNRIGAHIQKLMIEGRFRGPDDYSAFSNALKEATVEAARQACKALPRKYSDDLFPARLIVVGGDDVTVIVPAPDAFDFVNTLLEAFDAACSARSAQLGGELTMSAGVAFINPRYPFASAHSIAESLAGTAKVATAKHDGVAAFSFHRVTTSLLHEDSFEPRAYTRKGGVPILERALAQMPHLPKGKLRTLLGLLRSPQTVDHGDRAAQLTKRIRDHAGKDTIQKEACEDFFDAIDELAEHTAGTASAAARAGAIEDVLTLHTLRNRE